MTGGRLNSPSGSLTLLTLLVVVAVLYFARSVLIPVTLSVLFAFLLGPLVVRFRNWGFGRIPSAAIVVIFSLAVAAAVSFMMFTQLIDLAHSLPGYQENMERKIRSIRESGSGLVNRVSQIVYKVNDQLKPLAAPESVGPPSSERPVPVEIRHPAFSPVEMIQNIIGSVLGIIVTAAIVVVFVLFMLIQRQDLRERVIRLAGARRINLTTTLLDDAAHRVSRYLLAQLLLNSSYGLLAGIGLYLIGVPNPVLWGILTMLLRYVPYIGIWIAAAMPAALAFAADPGWTQLLLIAVLYFSIDMVMYNFLEPLLYGSSTGLSPIAVLVTTVFWTWLWGAVGLLLATPLTVCVVVLGRHVPSLQFLSVLLSDENPLTDDFRFYQRMLAMDIEEASDIAHRAFAKTGLAAVYDQIIVPALTLAEHERKQGKLDEMRMRFLVRNTRELIDDLAAATMQSKPWMPRLRFLRSFKTQAKTLPEVEVGMTSKETSPDDRPTPRYVVTCIPARDETDELAAAMLVNVLKSHGIPARQISSSTLTGDPLEVLHDEKFRGIGCVCAVPPFGYQRARHVCSMLRAKCPDLKIVGAVLTERDVDQLRQRQPPLQADELATSLGQALTVITSIFSADREPAAKEAAAA